MWLLAAVSIAVPNYAHSHACFFSAKVGLVRAACRKGAKSPPPPGELFALWDPEFFLVRVPPKPFLVAWIPSPKGGGPACLFEILGALGGIPPPWWG